MRYLLILIFIFGCAFNKKELEQLEDFEGGKGENLLDQLDIDKNVVDKFRVEKEPETLEKKTDKKKIVKKKKKKKKKLTPRKVLTQLEKVRNREEYPKNYVKYDKESAKIWENYKPKIIENEKAVYQVKYSGVNIGNIFMALDKPTTIQGRDVYHFIGRLKSSSYYSYIYELDDKIESFVDVEYFKPIKFSMEQDESSKKVSDLQLFDWEELKTYYRYRKIKKGKASYKKKDEYIPSYFQDSFSAMYFLRGLNLTKGKKYSFPVVTRGKIWLMDVSVLGTEQIDTEIGEKSAIKLQVITRYAGELAKKGDISLWISNDNNRVMLQFEAEVKIGSVSGRIISYQR